MKKLLSIALAGLLAAPLFATQAHAATPCQPSHVTHDQQWLQSLLAKYHIQLPEGAWHQISVMEAAPSQAKAPEQKAPAQKVTTQKAQAAPAQKAPTQAAPAQKAPAKTSAAPSVNSYEQQVVNLTNQERQKAGLPALKLNTALSKMARDKSADMRDKGYFDHRSPTYGSPFDMMKAYGISYRAAGENIAAGQPDPQAVVDAWMKSPGHRANILNKSFTEIGVGYVKGGSYGSYWTQEFIGN